MAHCLNGRRMKLQTLTFMRERCVRLLKPERAIKMYRRGAWGNIRFESIALSNLVLLKQTEARQSPQLELRAYNGDSRKRGRPELRYPGQPGVGRQHALIEQCSYSRVAHD
jgi:hypothetical protein